MLLVLFPGRADSAFSPSPLHPVFFFFLAHLFPVGLFRLKPYSTYCRVCHLFILSLNRTGIGFRVGSSMHPFYPNPPSSFFPFFFFRFCFLLSDKMAFSPVSHSMSRVNFRRFFLLLCLPVHCLFRPHVPPSLFLLRYEMFEPSPVFYFPARPTRDHFFSSCLLSLLCPAPFLSLQLPPVPAH